MSSNRISLTQFVKNYSEANQSEVEIIYAAVAKLDTKSDGYRLAVNAKAAFKEFFDYLDTSGFEL